MSSAQLPEEEKKVNNEDFPLFPFLLIRGKNLPLLQSQPEVRVLRSADFFSDDDNENIEDLISDNDDSDNNRQEKSDFFDSLVLKNDDNEDDEESIKKELEEFPYILVEEDNNVNKQNDDSEPKDLSVLLGINEPAIKQHSEIILENSDSNQNKNEKLGEDIQKFYNFLQNYDRELSERMLKFVSRTNSDNEKINKEDYYTGIDVKNPTKFRQYIETMKPVQDKTFEQFLNQNQEREREDDVTVEKPETEEDVEESEDSDPEMAQQQETIYGTINYNNANDEETRRLSNFYRKHRYDIKKPGPKYLENYFFEDFFKKPTENSDISGSENDNSEPFPELSMNNVDNNNEDEQDTKDSSINDKPEVESFKKIGKELQKFNVKIKIHLWFCSVSFITEFEKKIVTENPEEQTIRSSLPLSEGPVKVDAKLRNTLIIRKADQNEPTSLEAIDSTHTYVIMDHQITTDGSKLFIKTLEQVFRLPRGTFSNLRLEKQQITFKVNPNYRDLNASQVAGKIGEFFCLFFKFCKTCFRKKSQYF